MKILVGLLVFLIICIGFAFYGLFHEDLREKDGISRENLVKCRKKSKKSKKGFYQDFGCDVSSGMASRNNELSGFLFYQNSVKKL